MEFINSEHVQLIMGIINENFSIRNACCNFNSLSSLTKKNYASSPLVRSKRTAEIIWGDREEAILTDSELREIDLYSFQVRSLSLPWGVLIILN